MEVLPNTPKRVPCGTDDKKEGKLSMDVRRSRVVVVGTGHVDMTVVSTIVANGLCNEVVLINRTPQRAQGEAMDLADGEEFFSRYTKIRVGDWSDCADADIVIITAGARPIPGQSRLSELGADIDIVDPILKSVMASGFDGMLIMVSNPVDVLAWFAWKRTGLPSRQVIGTGTALDTARMKTIIAERTHLDPRTVGDYVIGEHGDSQFIPWSTVNIVGKPFARYLSDNAAKYPDVTLDGIEEAARRRGMEIKALKGGTNYGIAATVAAIVKTILWDERRVMPVSTLIDGQYSYDEHDVFLSLPVALDGDGVGDFVDLHLTDDEMARFHDSARIVREHCAMIADRL